MDEIGKHRDINFRRLMSAFSIDKKYASIFSFCEGLNIILTFKILIKNFMTL